MQRFDEQIPRVARGDRSVPAPFRALLRIAPSGFRQRYGDEVLAFLSERLAESERDGESRVRVWSRITIDLGSAVAIEWLRVLTRRAERKPVIAIDERLLSPEERMSVIGQEILHSARSLRKSAGFSAAAVLTLALGIASTTAIFSIVDSVLLRPLPFPEADRVVVPETMRKGTGERSSISYADYMDWRDNHVFEYVAPFNGMQMDLTGSGDPIRVKGAYVGPQFFGVIGAKAMRGRVLETYDFPVEAARAIVISDRLWRTQFGSRENIVGSSIEINGIKRTVVGVLPPGTGWPLEVDAWVPYRLTTEQDPDLQRRDNLVYQDIARLKPGATLESTRAAMALLAERAEQANPVIRKDITTVPTPVLESLLGTETPRALWILLGAVGLLLLIGCVNVANLQLARATARQRELAVRTALGASRFRLVRQSMIESTLIGLTGGAVGVVLSVWMVRAMVAAAPADVPRITEASVNPAALGFAFAVSIAVALLFGLVPALQSLRTDPHQAMGEGNARTAGGRAAGRARRTLVIVELALSVLLLIGAGLALRSIQRLRNAQPGFDASSILTATISLPGTRYPNSAASVRFLYAYRDRLAAAPGIKAVGITTASPLGAGGFYLGRSMAMQGKSPTPENEIPVNWNVATPGYFDALDMRIRGRDFTARDDSSSTPVMIVNEEFARAMFGTADPIGKRAMSTRDEKVYREIIGVVPNVKFYGMRDSARALVWVPYGQNAWGFGTVTVRTVGAPEGALATMRRELNAIDPNIVLADVLTMNQAAARSIASDKMIAVLLTAFATLALALAAIGIFGVLSYSIAQRTHELGVRIAVGAQRSDVLLLVMRETAPLVLGGVAIGVGTGLAITRLLRGLLFEVQPTDPATFLGVAALLTAVGAIAALVPARHASRIDPLIALRRE